MIVSCSSDADCASGEICGQGGTCTPAPACSSDADCPEGKVCGADNVCVVKSPEPSPSGSAIAPNMDIDLIKKTETLDFKDPKEAAMNFVALFQEWDYQGEFLGVKFKNTEKNKFLGLKDVFDSFKIKFPDEFYNNINQDSALVFIYSQKEGNRLGFIAEVKDGEKLRELLRKEEKEMSVNLAPLFSIAKENLLPYVPKFRDSSEVKNYDGPDFRFQTLSVNDLGILYLISEKYLVFTTSWDSMMGVIKKVKLE